jgi:ERCC4-type nuclease
MSRTTAPAPTDVLFSLAVLIDRREKSPYPFTGFTADEKDGGLPLRVLTRTVELCSGDYSLAGLGDEVAIERKSLEDLFHTLGQARPRFEKELTRLSALSFAAVVVEAELSTILEHPPAESQLSPKVVIWSIMHYQLRFPTIHWWFTPGRRAGEVVTFRLLEAFARRWKAKPSAKDKSDKAGEKQS